MKDYLVTKEITEVRKENNFFYVKVKDGGFGFPDKYGVEPKVGDQATLHLMGGSFVRGIDLNGEKVFYKTEQDLEEERRIHRIESRKRNEEKFLKQKDKLDADFASLPKFFQDKIQQNRDADPNYRMDFEAYDMLCHKQAFEIAKRLPKFEGVEDFNIKERINRFHNMPLEEQIKAVPTLDKDHSENSFNVACSLAAQYLSSPAFALNKIVEMQSQQEKSIKQNNKYSI